MKSKNIPLPFTLLNLESVETKGKHYKNLNISRSKRAFQMKQKAVLIVFEGVPFSQKIFDKT